MGSQDAQRPRSLQLRLDGMHAEEQRLRTFVGWPVSCGIDSARIARAGFFYTGRGLEVECFACGGRISDWNYADSAMARHRELNPNCPFVLNPIGSSNIPIAIASSSPSAPADQKGYFRGETSIYERGRSDYRKEEDRFASFCREDGKRWPVPDKVSPSALAKAGFYWNPSNVCRPDADLSDRVTCAFCNGSLGGWESGDDPESEHRRCLPACPFVVGAPVGNVPIPPPAVTSSPVSTAAAAVTSGKEEGCSRAQSRIGSDQGNGGSQFGNEKLVAMLSSSGGVGLAENQGAESLGVHRHKGPRNERYATMEARLASFNGDNSGRSSSFLRTFVPPKDSSFGWPTSRVKQTPRALAEAGFFYTGQADQVRCFYCDGGLWDWQENDDPWVEHVRWFPNCAYVLLVKGEAFVETAKSLKPSSNPGRCNSSSSPVSPGTASSVSSPHPSQHQPSSHATGSSDAMRHVHPVSHAPRTKIRSVTSEELDSLMGSPAVMMALEIGLDAGRVRNIVQRKIEETGVPFSSPDDLVLEVLGSQREERDNIESDDDSEDERQLFYRRRGARSGRHRNQRFLGRRTVRDPEYDSGSDETSDEDNPAEESDGDSSSDDEEGEVEEGEIVAREDNEMIAQMMRELDRALGVEVAASLRNHGDLAGEAVSETQYPARSEVPMEDARNSSNIPFNVSPNAEDDNGLGRDSSLVDATRMPVDSVSEEASNSVISKNKESVSAGREGGESSVEMVDTKSANDKKDSSVAISASLAALEEENRRFRESRLCKVCLDEEVGVVFLPCGHLVSCVHCAPSLKDCPMCRRPIGATVRTYLS